MIINLTQHPTSAEQKAAGVVDLPAQEREALKSLLTFEGISTVQEVLAVAEEVAELACQNGLSGDEGDSPMPDQAMVGGALWLMAPLCAALRVRSIDPVFAFSARVTSEVTQPDGTVTKVADFKHLGFQPAV